jgi:RNA polymerase sigma factor (TIGR02999 family)
LKPDATSLLVDWRRGSRDALDSLFPLVYEELRRVAHRALRGQPSGLTLSTTALVHESYLKLIVNERVSWQDRAHFLALASRAMRFVLVSYARAHGAKKRGGGRTPLVLDEDLSVSDERADEMQYIEDELTRLRPLRHPDAVAIDGVARWNKLVISAAYPHNVDGAVFSANDCARMIRAALPVACDIAARAGVQALGATLIGTAYRMPADLAIRAFVDGLAAASATLTVCWSLPDATHRDLAIGAWQRVR